MCSSVKVKSTSAKARSIRHRRKMEHKFLVQLKHLLSLSNHLETVESILQESLHYIVKNGKKVIYENAVADESAVIMDPISMLG